jgi:hypothetical protein
VETVEASPDPFNITSPPIAPQWSQAVVWLRKKFPPSWLTDWITRNATHGLAMEETPPTDFDAAAVPHEEMVGSIEQPLLNPHHFLDDHLQLIFEMHQNLEDQLHNQSILNSRMDLLFNPYPVHRLRSVVRLATNCSFSLTTMKDTQVHHTSSFSFILFHRINYSQFCFC